jgi:hypothetical protein
MRTKPAFALLIFNLVLSSPLVSQEVSVHFIHGSKPKPDFKHEEKKWHGGTWGGHIGVEIDSNQVIDFFPTGRVHWAARHKKPNGKFALRSQQGFWEYFGIPPESLERTTVQIPVSPQQKKLLDSLATRYVQKPPYDYAFFGMRCTSASCDILMQAGVLKKRSTFQTALRYFYPKKLRKRLLKISAENGWPVVKTQGSERRKWDRD